MNDSVFFHACATACPKFKSLVIGLAGQDILVFSLEPHRLEVNIVDFAIINCIVNVPVTPLKPT